MLLSESYKNSKEKLEFKCTCGRIGQIAFDKFKQGQLCSGCKFERSSEKTRYSLAEVADFFRKEGCVLLSEEYTSNKDKLRYVCECGTEAVIAFSKFKAGQRCKVCKSRKITEKLSGENSPFYDHSKTMEERIRDRKYPEYQEWRRKVFDRDDYTCQCCGQKGGKLNAHHIEAYSRNKELRTEISNGITLCEDCHKEYHSNFYKNNADKETFDEFLTGDYRDPWYAGEVFD